MYGLLHILLSSFESDFEEVPALVSMASILGEIEAVFSGGDVRAFFRASLAIRFLAALSSFTSAFKLSIVAYLRLFATFSVFKFFPILLRLRVSLLSFFASSSTSLFTMRYLFSPLYASTISIIIMSTMLVAFLFILASLN